MAEWKPEWSVAERRLPLRHSFSLDFCRTFFLDSQSHIIDKRTYLKKFSSAYPSLLFCPDQAIIHLRYYIMKKSKSKLKLLSYAKPYIAESVLGPLLKLAEAALDLIVPLIIAAMIDKGVGASDRAYLIKQTLLLVAAAAAGLLLSVTAQFFCAKAAVGFATSLRSAVFRHIQEFSYTELDSAGIPTLITRLTSDMNRLQNGVNLSLRLLLRSPFIVAGSIVMAFYIDVKSGWIITVAVAILAAVTFAVIFGVAPVYKRVQEKLDNVTETTGENLEGARVIRALTLEENERRVFYARNDVLNKTQRFAGRISALLNPLTIVIINLGIVALIKNGVISVETGTLTAGEVVALYNYMAQILIELVKFANLVVQLSGAIACGGRIQDVLEMTSENTDRRTETTSRIWQDDAGTVVRFDHAALKYSGACGNALSDINFEVKRGQTVGIIGGTGSGKTSLVNMIAGFYPATDGGVYVSGRNVNDYDPAELLSHIGIVPQKAALFGGTIRSNLLWSNGNASEDEMLAALKIAQADNIPGGDGLDKKIEQGGRNLSGGQRQRLTIARAVVRMPDILILDDSASALDYATDAALRRAIAGLPGDMTVFIVSQRAASVMNADMIITLDDGQIAGIGTHDELLRTCEVYKEIVSVQQS